MTFCESCGCRMIPDESNLCTACLSDEWESLRRRANLWDVNTLRATVDERPLPKTRTRKPRVSAEVL